jgi:hypothetical protein
MNAFVVDIFISHSIVLVIVEKDRIYRTTCDLVETGPHDNLRRIKEMVFDIS